MKNIILILGNPLNHEGGMVAFNKGIISTLNNGKKDYRLKHFSIGSRMSLFYYPVLKRFIYPFMLVFDLVRLHFSLHNKNIKVLQLNPSLILIPLIRDGLVQLMNCIVFKKKTVIVLHGWKEHVFYKIKANKVYSSFIRFFFNSADVIFVLSEEFKAKLIELGVESSKIKITTTFFYKVVIQKKNSKSTYSNKVNFIYLGRVSKLKGMDELIKAFEFVGEKYDNFICRIIGHGDKQKTLVHYKTLVKENNLQKKIIFLGRKTGAEKYALLNDADIYILPSYMEGCPTTAIEALASGLFVISTDVGALNDIINDFNGIKVKPQQITELAEAIAKSIESISDIRFKQNKIAQNTLNNFEVNKVANQFHTAYSSLI